MSALRDEIRFTARTLARSPGFAAMAVLTLALGIGGATAMYGFLRAAVLYGQPTLPEPEDVARLYLATPGSDAHEPLGLSEFRRWNAATRSFESLAAYAQGTGKLRQAEGVDEVQVLRVTASYLALLKTLPVLGRLFTADEARAEGGGVTLLSERAWRSRFGSDPGVLGQSLVVDGVTRTVVGVLPERLGLVMPRVDLFVPLPEESGDASVMVIARRRRGLSWPRVRAEMDAVGLAGALPDLQVRIRPILDDAGYRSRVLWLAAVGPALVVLLIGCGNVASLLLVRAVRRERETAVRLALGASRRRLALQLLVEGWALASAAGALGLALSEVGLRAVRALLPASVDLALDLDGRTLLFAALATFATPLVFAAAPLLHGLRVNLDGALRSSLQRPLFGVGRYRVRDLIAILEVGLSVGLVAFALLFLSVFEAMRSLELGFDTAGLVAVEVRGSEGAPEAAVDEDVARRLFERIAALPGVTRVTLGDMAYAGSPVRVGRLPSESRVRVHQVRVGPGYFETLRLPVVRGRGVGGWNPTPDGDAVVVNARLASHLWPGSDPVGEVLYVSEGDGPRALTVVGVAGDAVRLGRLGALDIRLDLRYALYRRRPSAAAPRLDLFARVEGRPTSLFGPIRAAVASEAPPLEVSRVSTVPAAIDGLGGQASPAVIHLVGGFGGLALLLAAIGVFAVMSQLVDERRVELGLRLALGASPPGLVRLVVGEGLVRVGTGSALGLAVLAAGARTGFAGLLTSASADPRLWLSVTAVVSFAAAAACYVPARRATRLDPMDALRSE